MSRLAVARVHARALQANLERARALAAPARVMAVIKADGYGHGLERAARAFASADAFGVAAIADGMRLRAAGFRQRIVVLSGPDAPGDLAELRRLELEAVIHHDSQLDWLEAEPAGALLRIWLKVDSGMHRLGFAPDAVRAAHARLVALPGVHPEIALMTHFAASDEFANDQTARQVTAFDAATVGLPGPRSLSNSAGLLSWPAARGDWVRIGGLLYGQSVVVGKTGADFGFAPAMTLATRLIAINRVARGGRVGYAGAWTCPEDMPVGVAAIGYGDGYPRSAAAGTPVLLRGRRVPLIGRVSMDLITLDLRGMPDAAIGDEVVLWGDGLPAEEVATHAGTISYVLTCGLTRRVLFVEGNG